MGGHRAQCRHEMQPPNPAPPLPSTVCYVSALALSCSLSGLVLLRSLLAHRSVRQLPGCPEGGGSPEPSWGLDLIRSGRMDSL